MAKLLGKWVADRAIDTNHIAFTNDAFVIGRNNADIADLNMFKINASDVIEFGIEPTWGTAPSTGVALANKDYVDAAIFGLRDPKDAVRVASTGNIDIASAPAAIDGVALVAGDRIGLIAQTAGAENGIYVFTAAAAALTRSLDANEAAEVTQGLSFLVVEGTVNAYRTYALVTADPIVVDTTVLVFVQTPSLGNIVVFQNPVVTLIAGDITNGYIELAQEADANSLNISVIGGLLQEKAVDYTITVPVAVTRLTFAGDLLAGAVAGDKLSLNYIYLP